jgi:hydrogenase expression/formation protein HypD
MLRKKYALYDARKKYEEELLELTEKEFTEPVGCLCGHVLRGLISSKECPLFGRQCTPNNPVGPCMVSSEGNCNIQYRYSKK